MNQPNEKLELQEKIEELLEEISDLNTEVEAKEQLLLDNHELIKKAFTAGYLTEDRNMSPLKAWLKYHIEESNHNFDV